MLPGAGCLENTSCSEEAVLIEGRAKGAQIAQSAIDRAPEQRFRIPGHTPGALPLLRRVVLPHDVVEGNAAGIVRFESHSEGDACPFPSRQRSRDFDPEFAVNAVAPVVGEDELVAFPPEVRLARAEARESSDGEDVRPRRRDLPQT